MKFNITFFYLIFSLLVYNTNIILAADYNKKSNIYIIAPVYGYHFNQEFHTERILGQPKIVSTRGGGYQSGVFFQMLSNKFSLSEFPFYARTNHSNVFGNILFAGYDIAELTDNLKLNFGIGYIYHKIETSMTEIDINVYMPRLGIKLNFSDFKITPYYSRVKENNETEVLSKISKKKYYYDLYGIILNYSFKHFWQHTLRYYYGNINKSDGRDIYTIRYYNSLNLTKTMGLLLKYEYEKHKNEGVDKSITLGPFLLF